MMPGTPRPGDAGSRSASLRMMMPVAGERVLDLGCGTGHFSRRFAAAGLQVTGADPDAAALGYAGRRDAIAYVRAGAEALPWPAGSFHWVSAVTSLCFVAEPQVALAEAWRVARRGVALGLLNRHSLLYRRKRGRGGYVGARWDRPADVRRWLRGLMPPPRRVQMRSAVFAPGGGPGARLLEAVVSPRIPLGAFLAVVLEKPGP